jgi:hypothetical protein
LIWLALATAILAAPGNTVVHTDERAAYEIVVRANVSEAYARFEGISCPSLSFRRVYAVEVKTGANPAARAMREQLKTEGCGQSLTINLNVLRTDGSPPWFIAARLPGESLAELSLQQKVCPAAVGQAHIELPPGCAGQSLSDVYVTARPGHVFIAPRGEVARPKGPGSVGLSLTPELENQRDNLNISAAWAETWPMKMCGYDRATIVVFIPLKNRDASVYLFVPVWRHGSSGRPGRSAAG